MRGIIYKYTNRINGKVYIGQTINELSRKSAHRNMASEWRSLFYNAIAKYGYDSFDYEVIYEVISDIPNYVKIVLDMMEVYYIAKYKSTNKEYGYNIAAGGGGTVGVHFSEEHKRKIAIALKGKNVIQTERQRAASLENFKKCGHNGSPKAICQYTIDGVFVREFNSIKEANLFIGGNDRAFARALREGINKGYYKGYYWIPKNSELPLFGYLQKQGTPILQYDAENNLIHAWESFTEVARAYNKPLPSVRYSLKKHPTNYLGYKWKILDNCSKQEKYELFHQKRLC